MDTQKKQSILLQIAAQLLQMEVTLVDLQETDSKQLLEEARKNTIHTYSLLNKEK